VIRQLLSIEPVATTRRTWRWPKRDDLPRFLDQLPLGDPAGALPLLNQRLLRERSAGHPPRQAVAIAVALHGPVVSVSENLMRLHAAYGLPLPQRTRDELEQSLQLNQQLLALFSLAHDAQLNRPDLLLALHGALSVSARILCLSEQLCARWPSGFWLDAHRTLALAAQARLLHVPLPSLNSPQPFSDVLNAYRRLLLLGALDLKSFARAEQIAIADAAWRWANDLEFIKPSSGDSQRAVFGFSPDEDASPRPRSRTSAEQHLFTLEPLVDRLTTFSMRLPADGHGASELPAFTLKRIIRHLGSATALPRALRIATVQAVQGWIGLSNIQRMLVDAAGRGAARLISQPGPVAQFTLGESVAQRFEGVKDFIRAPRALDTSQQTVTVDPRVPSEVRPLEWTLLDRSDEGFKLRCAQNVAVVRVGDLIAVAEGPQRIWVALVRWLAQGEGAFSIVGAQALALNPLPARVVVSDQRLPALALDAVESAELPASVIIPAHRAREGERALLDQGTGKRWIVLERVLEASPTILRMRFRAPEVGDAMR
jgi:hypothetical protein